MSARTQTVTAYSLTEAARRLGVSRWTIHRAIKEGKLPAQKSGNATIIWTDDLLEYVLRYRSGAGITQA
jgi:excisionase family DNA binding protein